MGTSPGKSYSMEKVLSPISLALEDTDNDMFSPKSSQVRLTNQAKNRGMKDLSLTSESSRQVTKTMPVPFLTDKKYNMKKAVVQSSSNSNDNYDSVIPPLSTPSHKKSKKRQQYKKHNSFKISIQKKTSQISQ